MCELATILAIGSTVAGAAGTIQQGQATAAAANYQSKVAEMNAVLSERQAQDALERGKLEEQKARTEAQRVIGQQTAAMAANGVDVSFGSPLDLIVDTAVLGEIDAMTIRSSANREAYDFRVKASNERAGAKMAVLEGKSAKAGSYLGAGGTLLGGLSKAYTNYKTA